MTWFVTLAAQQIQPWLTRTPKLSLARGASKALEAVTSQPRVGEALQKLKFDGAQVTLVEGLQISGVVKVKVDLPDQSTTCTESVHTIERVAEYLLTYAQHHLPGIPWQVWAAEADNYHAAEAKDRAHESIRFGGFATDVSIPFAQECSGCGKESIAVHKSADIHPTDGEQPIHFGPDCKQRRELGKIDAQDQMSIGNTTYPLAKEFPDLARLGVEGPTESWSQDHNHLATICADVNRLGALFTWINTNAPELMGDASQAVAKALEKSVASARSLAIDHAEKALRAAGCWEEPTKAPKPSNNRQIAPLIEHYVGGDDILVSIPARFAWEYAAHLAHTFETKLKDSLRELTNQHNKPELKPFIDVISLGVGIAFSHHSFPFSQAQAAAATAEREAKKATSGKESAISWVDLTVEAHVPSGRFITVDAVREQLDGTFTEKLKLAVLTEWTQSRRHAFADLLLGDWTPPENLEESSNPLKDFSEKRDDCLWSTLTDTKPPSAREIHEALNLLNQARWWPCPAS